MNFDLTKEQEALRQRVRDFAEQEIKPVARQNDEDQHFDVELTLKMAEQGLLGMTVPKEYGGQGLDNLSYIIAVEELARVDGSTAATIAADNSLGIGSASVPSRTTAPSNRSNATCPASARTAFGASALRKKTPAATRAAPRRPPNTTAHFGTSTAPRFSSPTVPLRFRSAPPCKPCRA